MHFDCPQLDYLPLQYAPFAYPPLDYPPPSIATKLDFVVSAILNFLELKYSNISGAKIKYSKPYQFPVD